MSIGIIAAFHEEIADLLGLMGETVQQRVIGNRTFYHGEICGHSCVIVLARIGKVAASSTCTTLIQTFGVRSIIFTGVAGGIHPAVNIGDVVIGTSFCQHDLNAEPLFPRYEVPLLGKTYFESDTPLNALLLNAAKLFLDQKGSSTVFTLAHVSSAVKEHSDKALTLKGMVKPAAIENFKLQHTQIHQGLIISGDQFVASSDAVQDLRQRFPQTLCTEMEGAAVAQVCYEYGVPFAVVRVVSDKADDNASNDFNLFLNEVASAISSGILLNFLLSM